jgi:hypothetical protein
VGERWRLPPAHRPSSRSTQLSNSNPRGWRRLRNPRDYPHRACIKSPQTWPYRAYPRLCGVDPHATASRARLEPPNQLLARPACSFTSDILASARPSSSLRLALGYAPQRASRCTDIVPFGIFVPVMPSFWNTTVRLEISSPRKSMLGSSRPLKTSVSTTFQRRVSPTLIVECIGVFLFPMLESVRLPEFDTLARARDFASSR